MASSLAFAQPAPAQSAPSVADGASGDLVNALAKYVTTGVGAVNTTQGELQELVSTAVAKPGGMANMEALIQLDQHCPPERTVWHDKAAVTATISLTKTGLTLGFQIPSLSITFEGKGTGFFRPFSGPMNNGTIWYNNMDNLQPGPADFRLHVDNLTLHVDIFRNQLQVASLAFWPIAFVLAPGIQEGTGDFA
ncbi:hypothetical protein SODALDRAFT_374386 [Sodiomyces alkalinus F11]|uniref:Uncharacterized protein n=1 Tax=Sodiomyces alkalinus (strain CBS 110278 / VKM F-3762 / F11) TaxID=1314773 RepID=A0A3N2Q5F3_SODAK|nr:hypothetical protein SODALDRAFT_374386 [Sodiomyces alkalinus F11]ROT42004.1 hypothetical protein SODALDRAFT_374386 [Sodiomyces alkalinus F11]